VYKTGTRPCVNIVLQGNTFHMWWICTVPCCSRTQRNYQTVTEVYWSGFTAMPVPGKQTDYPPPPPSQSSVQCIQVTLLPFIVQRRAATASADNHVRSFRFVKLRSR